MGYSSLDRTNFGLRKFLETYKLTLYIMFEWVRGRGNDYVAGVVRDIREDEAIAEGKSAVLGEGVSSITLHVVKPRVLIIHFDIIL